MLQNQQLVPSDMMPDDLELLRQQVASFDGAQYTYLASRLRDPGKSKDQTMRDIERAPATLDYWRSTNAAFKATDDAITRGAPILRSELARELILNYAPTAAKRLVGYIDMDADTDRKVQVQYQATKDVLKVAGVLVDQPSQLSIDARSINIGTLSQQSWQQGGSDSWRARRQAPRELPDPKEPGAAAGA